MDRLIKWDREEGYHKDKDRDKEKDKDRDREIEKGKDKGNASDNSSDGQKDDISRSHSVLGDGITGILRGPNKHTLSGPYSTFNNLLSGTQGGGEVGGALAYVNMGDEKDRDCRERERERNGVGGRSSVPTRQTVKKASSQALEEAKRKSGLALRRRR